MTRPSLHGCSTGGRSGSLAFGNFRTSTRRSTTGSSTRRRGSRVNAALPRLWRARRAAREGRRAGDPDLRTSTRSRSSPLANRLHRHEPVPRPDRRLPQVTRALAATLFAGLVLIPAAGTHGHQGGRHVPGRDSGQHHHRLDRPDPRQLPGSQPPDRRDLWRAVCVSRQAAAGGTRGSCPEIADGLPGGHERRQDIHVHDPEGRPLLDRLARDGSSPSPTRSTASSARRCSRLGAASSATSSARRR